MSLHEVQARVKTVLLAGIASTDFLVAPGNDFDSWLSGQVFQTNGGMNVTFTRDISGDNLGAEKRIQTGDPGTTSWEGNFATGDAVFFSRGTTTGADALLLTIDRSDGAACDSSAQPITCPVNSAIFIGAAYDAADPANIKKVRVNVFNDVGPNEESFGINRMEFGPFDPLEDSGPPGGGGPPPDSAPWRPHWRPRRR